MISPNDLRNGLVIKIDGELYTVIQSQHYKPGKGGAFVRTKLKSLKRGTLIDRTYRESEQLEEAFIEEKKLQYLYHSDGSYNFMDNVTYDQFHIDKALIGDGINYLKENMEVSVYTYKDEIVSVFLPASVELKVTETEQGIRGDTARGGNKPALVETGLRVGVPLFINIGDIIKIDTRTGKYTGRA
ncbi:MAG: elongation factor P [Candidatus Omnitrophota bacterium]